MDIPNKYDNIVKNQSLKETKTIDLDVEDKESAAVVPEDNTDPVTPEKKEGSKWDSVIKKQKEGNLNIYKSKGRRIEDKAINIDLEDYRDTLGPDIFIPEGSDRGVLDQQRSDKQGFFEQAGNFLAQGVVGEAFGGSIEGLGYVMDLGSVIDIMKGDEKEWGNFITEFGQGIREGTQKNFAIHQDPSAEGFGKMADSGWWFGNGVSAFSTISMLAPTMGAMKALSLIGKGIGASKGLRTLRKAKGMAEQMGTKSQWMTNGISQAVLSRNIENSMEAHGTFKSMKAKKLSEIDNKTGEKYTEEEATRIASNAASMNWKKGWAMLLQDIPQYLAIGKVFNPISKKMVSVSENAAKQGLKSAWKPWQRKTAAIASTFFGEGAEESYQYLISEQAKLKSDLDVGYITQEKYDKKMSEAMGSEEMLTSAFFGGLGGNLFQAVGGGLNNALQSKDRKEYEKNLGDSYADHLTNKSKQVSLMFQHLNNSDEKGSKVLRDQIINESMMNLATEALENDKFDQFYETIGLVSEMSEEDLKSFEEQTGDEFSPELAAQSAPELQNKAIEIRDIYLKNRDNYSPATSSRLSRLEMENKELYSRRDKNSADVQKIRNNARVNFKEKASESLYKKLELREKGQVLRRRKEGLKERLREEKENGSKQRKGFIQEAIDRNERLFKIYELATRKQTKENKESNLEEEGKEERKLKKENDIALEKSYNKLYKNDLLAALEQEHVAEESIAINVEDMAFQKSEEGIRLQSQETLKRQIKDYEEIVDKEKAVISLESVKKTLEKEIEYLSDVEKKEMKDSVDAKIKELKTRIGEDASREKEAVIRAEKEKKALDENNDETVASNQTSTEIDNVIEDENANEDPIITKQQIDASEKLDDKEIGRGDYMSILDKISRTVNGVKTNLIAAYDEYISSAESRVGQEFRYTTIEIDQNLGKAQNDAISAFKKLKKGDKIPQSIIDNLPIKTTHTEHSKVFSYLPTKPNPNDSLEKINNYKRGYGSQREIIITKLLEGEDVTATVGLHSGGELQMDSDTEERTTPENSLLDLRQIGGKISNIKLLATNRGGFLMDTFKEPDKELGNRAIVLDGSSSGNKMSYRGGMFLKVKKANGKPFALRLNLKRNTEAQADILAKLLLEVQSKAKESRVGKELEEGQSDEDFKGLTPTTGIPLSELDQELQDAVRENMGPEIEMLDKGYKDPLLSDLIDSFIYVDARTENKTSEIFFTPQGDLIFNNTTKEEKERTEDFSYDKLVYFLLNNKRRQFNLDRWNTNNDYKKYVLDNKLISTDATTDGSLFTNTRRRADRGDMVGRSVQLYMNPVTAESKKTTKNLSVDDEGVVTTTLDLSSYKKSKKEDPKVETPVIKDSLSEAQEDSLKKMKELYPEIKVGFTQDGKSFEVGDNKVIMNQEEMNSLNYRLKSVSILSSDKAKQVFAKGKKNGWDLNKILTELQVPKEQKQIILDKNNIVLNYGREGKLSDINIREEIVAALLSDNSFAVEVNTAKESKRQPFTKVKKENSKYVIYNIAGDLISEHSTEGEALKEVDNLEFLNTQHYSNLTVPGGTNYTENELSTPLIVPNIKGHGEFSTDNGIGWFRSDDASFGNQTSKTSTGSLTNEVESQSDSNSFKLGNDFYETIQEFDEEYSFKEFLKNGVEITQEEFISASKKASENFNKKSVKTRRILEVQSDLFQKGRDKKSLALQEVADVDFGENPPKEILTKVEENNFLQILNKKGNWVNFFVQSIVQDSVKKGYEKVLFPTGETAAKVEGLESMANEIERLNNDDKYHITLKKDKSISGIINSFKTKEEAIRDVKKQNLDVGEEMYSFMELNVNEKEINNFKTQGLDKLKPIEGFYTNKVANILKKNYKVNEITDEHGNTWNEIDLSQEKAKQEVLLQKDKKGNIKGQANIDAMTVLFDKSKMSDDTVYHEYAHHYVAWNRESPLVKEAVKKWGSEEALVQAIGEQSLEQKGEAWTWFKKFIAWLKNDINKLSKLDAQKLKNILTDAFLKREDLAALNKTKDNTVKKETINVYWGQAESKSSTKILSNLAPRKFTWENRSYGSVEHAYQSNKSGSFDKTTYDKYIKAGGSGTKIRGKGTVAQMKAADSLGLMKKLVVSSFKQNSESKAAKKLMEYKNFTHNTNQLIDQAFLEGLVLAQKALEPKSTEKNIQFDEETIVGDTDISSAGNNDVYSQPKGQSVRETHLVSSEEKEEKTEPKKELERELTEEEEDALLDAKMSNNEIKMGSDISAKATKEVDKLNEGEPEIKCVSSKK
ncbi:hypothetical protein [Clostridium sp.]|jgi:hypothetical protein|uniref:hypothetical protein n=1 Tax=Clostridium sp. TaxID=1506 RepID=UPI003EE83E71